MEPIHKSLHLFNLESIWHIGNNCRAFFPAIIFYQCHFPITRSWHISTINIILRKYFSSLYNWYEYLKYVAFISRPFGWCFGDKRWTLIDLLVQSDDIWFILWWKKGELKWSASWLKAFDVTLISYIDTRHKMLAIL
jgi:hypothetical protein